MKGCRTARTSPRRSCAGRSPSRVCGMGGRWYLSTSARLLVHADPRLLRWIDSRDGPLPAQGRRSFCDFALSCRSLTKPPPNPVAPAKAGAYPAFMGSGPMVSQHLGAIVVRSDRRRLRWIDSRDGPLPAQGRRSFCDSAQSLPITDQTPANPVAPAKAGAYTAFVGWGTMVSRHLGEIIGSCASTVVAIA